jgi:adenylate cyclase
VRVYRADPEGTSQSSRPRRSAGIPGFEGRPALAVLPFANFSGDTDQDYFADGLTDDLIHALSRWRRFPVISRASVFAYKAQNDNLRRIGRELGIRYALEGSVRRGGARLRITTQLVEAETGYSVFSERYDRQINDLFEVQDEIVESIVGALEPELLKAERERSTSARDIGIYELLQRAFWHHYRFNAEDHARAYDLFKQALVLDPKYAQAAGGLAVSLIRAVMSGWRADPEASTQEALQQAEHAVACDPRDPLGHFALGAAYIHTRHTWDGIEALKQAIRLNPSYADAHANLAFPLNYVNKPEEAILSVRTAMRLSPADPRLFIWLPALAGGDYLAGRYEAALATAERALAMKPDYLVPARWAAAALGMLGRAAEAGPMIDRVRRLDQEFTKTEQIVRRFFIDEAAIEAILRGLRAAGYS